MRHTWWCNTVSDIYNVYYYTFFKKNPCKICLVQPCCGRICLDKKEWNWNTSYGETKNARDMFNLIAMFSSASMLIFGIIAFIVK